MDAGYKGRRLDGRGWPIPNALDGAHYDPETGRRYLLMFSHGCETRIKPECHDSTAVTADMGKILACPYCGRDMTEKRGSYREYFPDDDPMPEPAPEPATTLF